MYANSQYSKEEIFICAGKRETPPWVWVRNGAMRLGRNNVPEWRCHHLIFICGIQAYVTYLSPVAMCQCFSNLGLFYQDLDIRKIRTSTFKHYKYTMNRFNAHQFHLFVCKSYFVTVKSRTTSNVISKQLVWIVFPAVLRSDWDVFANVIVKIYHHFLFQRTW